jgi:hypothetical protein
LFSTTVTFVSSRSAFPDEPQHSVHDATRGYPVHPGVIPNREDHEEAEAG